MFTIFQALSQVLRDTQRKRQSLPTRAHNLAGAPTSKWIHTNKLYKGEILNNLETESIREGRVKKDEILVEASEKPVSRDEGKHSSHGGQPEKMPAAKRCEFMGQQGSQFHWIEK